MSEIAVRDLDLPEVLGELVTLLDWLDEQRVTVGVSERARLRTLLGQVKR